MKVKFQGKRIALFLVIFILAIVTVMFIPTRSQRAQVLLKEGNAKLSKPDFDGAIKDYDEAIRLRPDYQDAFYNRGEA
jgi:hypothetical protein